MSTRQQYTPGPAGGAEIRKKGEQWTLVVTRTLSHPPATVWKALTDPDELRAWAPFDADRNLGTVGTAQLSTAGTPTPQVTESRVTRADAPTVLEFDWGGQKLRWELEPVRGGTRLTLWHTIDRRFISMGAAGWQICLDVLERDLDGEPIGRIAGPDVMHFEGWQRLNAEYARQFEVESAGGPSAPRP